MTMYQCWVRINYNGSTVARQIFDIPMEVIGMNGRLKKWIKEKHNGNVIEIWDRKKQDGTEK